jgi:hypothetical protein
MADNSLQRTRGVGLFLGDRKCESMFCIYGHCSLNHVIGDQLIFCNDRNLIIIMSGSSVL